MTDRFCIECGEQLEEGDKFCPACGAVVRDRETVAEGQTEAHQSMESGQAADTMSDGLRNVLLLTLLWGVVAVVTGLYMALSAAGLTDSIISTLSSTEYSAGKTYWDYFAENGYTRDLLVTGVLELGATTAASGVLALLSACFIRKRSHYTVAVLLLAGSALLAFGMMFTLIVGIVVCYFLSKCKREFVS